MTQAKLDEVSKDFAISEEIAQYIADSFSEWISDNYAEIINAKYDGDFYRLIDDDLSLQEAWTPISLYVKDLAEIKVEILKDHSIFTAEEAIKIRGLKPLVFAGKDSNLKDYVDAALPKLVEPQEIFSDEDQQNNYSLSVFGKGLGDDFGIHDLKDNHEGTFEALLSFFDDKTK